MDLLCQVFPHIIIVMYDSQQPAVYRVAANKVAQMLNSYCHIK